jgi:quercetin dioxygenase-like cupin family protein
VRQRLDLRYAALALTLIAGPAFGQDAPVIDNSRVTVRDITLAPGAPLLALKHAHPYVTMFLEGGSLRVNGRVEMHQMGDAVYRPAGSETDQVLSGRPHLVVVDLNETQPPPPLSNPTQYPLAFPRPGVRKVVENDRVIVWNYVWQPGKPTPMHFHDKDVVVIYRGEGTLDSVTPDGKHAVTPHHFGEIRFNKANRSHYELLTQGAQSAIMMELK